MSHSLLPRCAALTLLAALLSPFPIAGGATIKIDYSYDTAGFFNTGTANGALARAAIESAASYYSIVLTDTLAEIKPLVYSSPRITATWTWTMSFNNPSSAGSISLVDQTIPGDQIRVYVGAKAHTGSTLAVGGPGGYSRDRLPHDLSDANSTDLLQIYANDDVFFDAIADRGEVSGFAGWGGSISFDSDTNWHLNHTATPAAGKTDFVTVATHEMAHVLGFGALAVWTSLVGGGNFQGMAAKLAYGGPVPLNADNGHWADGINSTVFGGGASQTAIMVSTVPPATRRSLSTLDAAALTDIGWSVVAPPGVNGDYNNNGVVDAADYVVWRDKLNQSVTIPNDSTPGTVTPADYTVWRTNFGKTPAASGTSFDGSSAAVPEPGGIVLAIVASVVGLYTYRRQRR